MSEPSNNPISSNPQEGLEKGSQSNKDGMVKSKKEFKRNYHCGCGKSYLSNPALYTHIKTKHGGLLPQGSYNSVQRSKSKRGRPRKTLFNEANTQSMNEEKKESNEVDNQNISMQRQNKEIRMLEITQNMIDEKDLKVFAIIKEGRGVCEDIQSFFPAFKNCNNLKVEMHPFCQIIRKLQANQQKHKISIHASAEVILSLYLWCLSRLFNPNLYRLAIILFKALRECLNDFGYQLIEDFLATEAASEINITLNNKDSVQFQSDGFASEQASFTCNETAESIPLIISFFILNYIPKYAPSFDQNLALILMQDFCSWLNHKRFSKVQISIHPFLLTDQLKQVYSNEE